MLQFKVVFIAPIVEVVNGKEDLSEIEVFPTELLVAELYVWLDLVFLLDFILYFSRDVFDIVIEL